MPANDVIERRLVDISLKGGLNEHDRPESIDWTQWLTTADNVSFDEYGVTKKRPGLVMYMSETDPNGGSLEDILKAFRLPMGLGFYRFDQATHKTYLMHMNEAESSFAVTQKGELPKYSVEKQTVSSWSTSPMSCISSIVLTENYKVIVTRTSDGVRSFHSIVFVDRRSNNIVRNYIYNPPDEIDVLRAVYVGSGRIHFFGSRAVGGFGVFFQLFEGLSDPSGPISPVTSALTSGQTVVDAAFSNSGSIVLYADSTLETRSFVGATLLSVQLSPSMIATGLDTDRLTGTWVAGTDGANFVLHRVNAALAITNTSTLATGGVTGQVRVAVNPQDASRECVTVIWRRGLAGIFEYPKMEVSRLTAGAAWTVQKTVAGWLEASLPFCRNNSFFITVANGLSFNVGVNPSRQTVANSVVVAEIGDITTNACKSAAVVDGYVATLSANDLANGSYNNTLKAYPHRPVFEFGSDDVGRTAHVAVMNQASSGSVSFDFVTLVPGKASVLNGYDDCFPAGGLGVYYDASSPTELGFVNAPSAFTATSGAGSVDVGVHSWCVQYEYKCFDGQSRFSRPSAPSTLTLGVAGGVAVTYLYPSVGLSPFQTLSDKTVAHVYRTSAGGRVMHLVGSTPVYNQGPGATFTDNISDATLITRPQMNTQPLVSTGPLERYHTLAPSCMVKHKDRVFYAHRSNVYYSSFFIDGEAPWFNPVFNIPVFGGTGDITALASMDGILVVFKEDAIFLIDGDGPPENGGNGTEFTPPRRIQTEFGCVDQRSVLPMPEGIMFRSRRGLEFLTTNGRVNFVGERVSRSVDANKHTLGCLFDRVLGRALYLVANEEVTGQPYRYQGARIIALDITTNSWSTWTPQVNLQDIVYADVDVLGTPAGVVYLGANQSMTYVEFDGICTDSANPVIPVGTNGLYVPQTLETGWIRAGMSERLIVDELIILAKNLDNNNLKVSVAYDYSSEYVELDATVFEPSGWVGEELKQAIYQVPEAHVQAIRFKLEDKIPDAPGTYPVGKGRGVQFMGITVKFGVIPGGIILPGEWKG